MFHSIKRLLHWAGGYRKRLYLGCLCSFFQCMVYCYTYCDCCMDFGACDC